MAFKVTGAPMLFLALAVASPAAAMPMAGSFSGRVDNQAPQMLGPNAVRVQQTANGLNAGPGTPLDGAKVQWSEIVTLTNGQGPVEGTITFITPSGTTSSPYTGTVTTDPQGRVTARGKFRTGESTGDFAGLKGNGSFSVAYSSRTDFTGEWRGDFKMPGRKTSRR
ncbi:MULTISPECIES: hypothetical protein [Methylobacterium]|uniref:hypothetical protein n=1 Tax=Methylobacterium TaxID=407 RepID=UPI0010456388|nr:MULTISPECIES: hypothetical protein [Methylobacterium]MDR7037344.1 hypothetical protein [Methylobacterium sp. BE186]